VNFLRANSPSPSPASFKRHNHSSSLSASTPPQKPSSPLSAPNLSGLPQLPLRSHYPLPRHPHLFPSHSRLLPHFYHPVHIPSVTVQNKVGGRRAEARRTLRALKREFEERKGMAEGLVLWRYEAGGQWSFLKEFGFEGK